jgi:hypothetical protein
MLAEHLARYSFEPRSSMRTVRGAFEGSRLGALCKPSQIKGTSGILEGDTLHGVPVNHRGPDVAVTQELLDGADVWSCGSGLQPRWGS